MFSLFVFKLVKVDLLGMKKCHITITRNVFYFYCSLNELQSKIALVYNINRNNISIKHTEKSVMLSLLGLCLNTILPAKYTDT